VDFVFYFETLQNAKGARVVEHGEKMLFHLRVAQSKFY